MIQFVSLNKKYQIYLIRNRKKKYMKPKIVCLCGSTKFKKAFEVATLNETLAGNIVLSVGCYMHADHIPISAQDKILLDELHLKKIDLADEILVLNKNGYIGESTKCEIKYAKSQGKHIRYWEKKEK